MVRGWLHLLAPRGVRGQATWAAAVVVAVALVAGGTGLVLLLHTSLTSTVQSTLEAVVDEDAAVLADRGVAGLRASEVDRGADGILVQVVAADGTLAYTSARRAGTPVSALRPAPGEEAVSGRSLLPLPDALTEPMVVARGATVPGGGDVVVLARRDLEAQEEAVEVVGGMLVVGVPLLVLVAAVVTWWRVGPDVLGTVEDIRAQVERIGGGRLAERVPVPPSRDEVAHLATTMNEMLTRLQRSDDARQQFVADASHELRSPLATLTAAVEVADADPGGRVWHELGPVVAAESARMQRMVDDLLLLSKADGDALGVTRDDVDLEDVVGNVARRVRRGSGGAVEVDAVPVRLVGDAHQLGQLVHNLVENATRLAGRVEVRVRPGDDGGAVLVVDDDGPGIAPDDRERVFERFTRLDASRARHSGGSGLGLAIVREIAAAHGGTVRVETSPLGGARFVVTLAAAPSATVPAQPATSR
ncbi:sensor histidine kinase [Terracoccus luteus]|uniref:histidine kinase n=1 Tax=Terracoccus luteus TaxID=53356 RepID=A0A839Q335_9MICO|nr:HAMP domain-containing sensor histidine kinase [Terracoccus luteus]MBB2987542.1 signal transduction histidine kinase [Terracoccus luteus]MCP2173193.1 signal transduction histidine kinase [Terracoccus luteus]